MTTRNYHETIKKVMNRLDAMSDEELIARIKSHPDNGLGKLFGIPDEKTSSALTVEISDMRFGSHLDHSLFVEWTVTDELNIAANDGRFLLAA